MKNKPKVPEKIKFGEDMIFDFHGKKLKAYYQDTEENQIKKIIKTLNELIDYLQERDSE